MALSRAYPDSAAVTAMVCSGAIGAQFIAGKATRDALYLAHLDVTSLPAMVAAASALSIFLAVLSSKGLTRLSPASFVPLAFIANAILLVLDWLLLPAAPAVAACAVFLQISGLGPILGSGFWLIATERFDPHTARHRFGLIASIGTLTGLASALLTERVGALLGISAMLPILAAINVVCAWQIRRLAQDHFVRVTDKSTEHAPELAAAAPLSGVRVLARTPYLRNLGLLVLLGTAAAALADYAFKAQAVDAIGRGDNLLRFFAIFYAATSLLAFAVQTGVGKAALEHFGLAISTATPSLALIGGGIGALLAPGLPGTLVARGAESVMRGSVFRTVYEIFYTPVPSAEKRAAKAMIDVGCDRFGDAIGSGLLWLILLLPVASQYGAIIVGAVCCSAIALLVARRLNRGYIGALERSLVNRAVELDLADVEDHTTRTVMLRTLREFPSSGTTLHNRGVQARDITDSRTGDPELQRIAALRSRNRERVLAVLNDPEALPETVIPYVIPLLAWDPCAEAAIGRLRQVADRHIGALTDALLDPNQPFAVRRRVPRVLSGCLSQRAVDGLVWGLDDLRFEVRFQCGRVLTSILEKSGGMKIEREGIFDVVRREVQVGQPVWESQRLVDRMDENDGAFADEFLKDRAGQSLAHVFTLLSLVLPMAPLQIAYRGLHTSDPALRGTALEYLEGVFPPDIRERLWPFIGGLDAGGRPGRSREAILNDLLRSNESIVLNLEELRKRAKPAAGPKSAAGV